MINFLRMDKINLIEDHSRAFLIADHVAGEASESIFQPETPLRLAFDSGELVSFSLKPLNNAAFSPSCLPLDGSAQASLPSLPQQFSADAR